MCVLQCECACVCLVCVCVCVFVLQLFWAWLKGTRFCLLFSVCDSDTQLLFVLNTLCFIMSGVLPRATGAVPAVKAYAKARTALAKRVPKPQKTGNNATDKERADTRDLFMDVIDHCVWDPSNIVPLYGTLRQRLKEAESPTGEFDFKVCTTV